ncbi:hypothetical protein EI94DRAFT_1661936 [Lactarius quietus]|nr:hypothetical protein EI94DRAFT_1661936 [Lactarius quietus]
MSDGFASPRVNAARIKDFLGCGHPVRITGKVLNFSDDETHLLMEASDGGKVKVLLPPVCPASFPGAPPDPSFRFSQPPQLHNVTDTFVEIIGNVQDASTIKFMACINMGPKLGVSIFNSHFLCLPDP